MKSWLNILLSLLFSIIFVSCVPQMDVQEVPLDESIDDIGPPADNTKALSNFSGKQLYDDNCLSCHQSDAQGVPSKASKTRKEIYTAIFNNVGGMEFLKNELTSKQLDMIEAYLAGFKVEEPAPAPVVVVQQPLNVDGKDLYATNCASCHMALENSTKINKTAAEIQNAIYNNGVMKGIAALTKLTMAQVDAISMALKAEVVVTPAPTTSYTILKHMNIGANSVEGQISSTAPGIFDLSTKSGNIWGNADSFFYAYTELSGDGVIEAKIDSLLNVDPWAKSGVMIRETLTPGSKHAFSLIGAGKGPHLFYRPTTDGATSYVPPANNGETYVKLERVGDVFTSYMSVDGSNWTVISKQTIAMATNVYIGIALNGLLTTATVESSVSNVKINGEAPMLKAPLTNDSALQALCQDQGLAYFKSKIQPTVQYTCLNCHVANQNAYILQADTDASMCKNFLSKADLVAPLNSPVIQKPRYGIPSHGGGVNLYGSVVESNIVKWIYQDFVDASTIIKQVQDLPLNFTNQHLGDATGTSSYSNGSLNINAIAYDSWFAHDDLNFAYLTLSGNGSLSAHVSQFNPTGGWSKLGLMVRTGLNADSSHAFLIKAINAKGTTVQYRPKTGMNTYNYDDSDNEVNWLKLVRLDKTVIAYVSADGQAWQEVGMVYLEDAGDTVYIGVALNSFSRTASASATLDNLKFTTGDEIKLSAITKGDESCGIKETIQRKLSFLEYMNIVNATFGLEVIKKEDLPSDLYSSSGYPNVGEVQSLDANTVNKYFDLGFSAVDNWFAMSGGIPSYFAACIIGDNSQKASCFKTKLQGFLTKLFRRPPSQVELNDFSNIFINTGANSNSMKTAITAMLVSPDFLFVQDFMKTVNNTENPIPRANFNRAQKLSLLLWAGTLDDRLVELAMARQLYSPNILKREISRMLKDRRAEGFVRNFSGNWLGIEDIEKKIAEADVYKQHYAGFDQQLLLDMKKETYTFVDYILKNDLPIKDIMGANFTFLNQNLATFYNQSGTFSSSFIKANLNVEKRRGILSQASFLTAHSHADATSIVERGKSVVDRVLCRLPGSPPLDVVAQIENSTFVATHPRDYVEMRKNDPDCAGCHAQMDPLGLSLESFDPLGQWRVKYETGQDVLPGETIYMQQFKNQPEMAQIVSINNYEFSTCLTKHLTHYLQEKEMSREASCVADNLASNYSLGDLSLADIVQKIILRKENLNRGDF